MLRFEGRILSENKEENDQRYIIQFFCGDDTIQVYKMTSRNSGIQGGPFMKKQMFKNPSNANRFYTP